MPTTITITGTGCPIPDADRAGPGVLLRHEDVALQFDAGRSTVQRLAGAGLWPTELDAVFVTHHHSDHLTGLQDLVLTRWVMDRTQSIPPLPIVAPEGPSVSFIAEMLHAWRHDIAIRLQHSGRDNEPDIEIVGFELPATPTEVWRSGGVGGAGVMVKAGRVRHEPLRPAVGFRVETPDGVVAISGDTVVCDEVAELAHGADLLIYEAMRFEEIEALPERRRFILDYHADTRLIGVQANELDVSTLVLTHLIPAPATAEERQAFVDDIRAGGFSGELIVADDLCTITIGG